MTTTLITGASSGLGAEMARQFAAHGQDHALAARRLDRLEELREKILADYPDLRIEIRALDVLDDDAVFAVFEDFAETFAHYLHISDTLATVAVGGVVLRAERVDGLLGEDVVPRQSYLDAPVEEMLRDWRWLSMLLNRASRAMGKGDLYPFTIVEPVVRKFAFVHKVVQDANAATVRPILD